MNPRCLARTLPRSKPLTRLPHRSWSTYDNPPPSPSQRAPLPSNTPRSGNAGFSPTRDAGIALANSMMQDIDRGNYKKVRAYDAGVRAEDVEKSNRARDLEKQMPRLDKWKVGDVYAPHDLGPVEAAKWKVKKSSERDVFDVLGINPLHEYKNSSMMSEFTTPMGRIKPRKATGLRAVTQRKIAKAIRRAVGMGLLPSVHRHPEVLEVHAKAKAARLDGGLGPRR